MTLDNEKLVARGTVDEGELVDKGVQSPAPPVNRMDAAGNTGFGAGPAPLATPNPGFFDQSSATEWQPPAQGVIGSIEQITAGGQMWSETDHNVVRGRLMQADLSLAEDPARLDRMAQQFLAVADRDLVNLLMLAPEKAMALTEDEYARSWVQEQIDNGGHRSDDAALLLSFIEQYEDLHGRIGHYTNIVNDQELVAAEFDATSVTRDDAWRAVWEPDLISPVDQLEFDQALEKGTARAGMWKLDGQDLAFAWTDDTGTFTAHVELEPGTILESTADAIGAYALAEAGIKHTLAEGEAPGEKTPLGSAFSALGNSVRWAEKHGQGATLNYLSATVDDLFAGGAETSAKYDPEGAARLEAARARTKKAEIEARNAVTDYRTKAIAEKPYQLAVVGDMLEAEGVVGPGEGILAADEWALEALNEANPDYFSTVQAETKDQLLSEFDTKEEEAGYVVPFFEDKVLPHAVELLTTYDKLIHTIGLGIVAIPGAAGNVFDGEAETTILSAFDDAWENDYVSEAFGIEANSAMGTWLNLGASVLFDPITWVTAGGTASWKMSHRMLADPALAGRFIRQSHIQSGIRQVVNFSPDAALSRSGTRVVMPFIQIAKSNPDDFHRIVALAGTEFGDDAAKLAAKQEMAEILVRNLPSNGGTFTGAGPAALRAIKDAQGLGAAFSAAPGASKSKQKMLAGMLARASRDRARTMGDDFIEEAWAFACHAGHNDLDESYRIFDLALQADHVSRTGTKEAVGAVQHKIERLKRLVVGDKARLNGNSRVGSVENYRASLPQLRDDLARAVEAGDTATSTRLEQLIDNTETFVAANSDEFDAIAQRQPHVRKELEQAEHELKRLRSGEDRQAIEDWWHRQYQEWGRRLGLDETGNDHPFLKDAKGNAEKELDWSPIVGEKEFKAYQESSTQAARVEGWAGSQDLSSLAKDVEKRIAQLDAEMDEAAEMLDEGVGLTKHQRRSYEDRYDAARKAQAKARDELDQMKPDEKFAPGELEAVGVFRRRGQTIMPSSAIELLAYENGRGAYKSLRAQAARQTATAVLDTMQTIFATAVLLNLNTPVKTHFDEIIRFIQDSGFHRDTVFKASTPERLTGEVGSRGALYQRLASSPVEHRMRPWAVINPSERGQWRAAERWVNGSLVRDDAFKQWAIAVREFGDGDEARRVFAQWWDTEGSTLARRQSLGGTAIDADRAYDAVRNGLDTMLSNKNVKDPKRWRTDLLEAAGTGKGKVDVPVSRWKEFSEVPGQQSSNGGISRVFDALYGAPSARRGGVIFDHYYKWMSGVLDDAWKGRVIDEEMIVRHGFAQDVVEARRMLAEGERSPVIRSMTQTGYRLQSDVDSAAASFAKQTADSMMYQMGSVSVAGRKLSRVYPWGRAQTDYLGYWTKKLMEPTTFQMQAGTKGVGASKTVNTGVNLRLLDRIGHMSNLGVPHDRAEPYTPQWFVEGFSFIPAVVDDSIFLEIAPSPGPLASWLVNFMPEDALPRRAFEEVHPSHHIFNDYENRGMSALANFVDGLIPRTGRSLRTAGAVALSGLAAAFGVPTDNIGTVYNFLIGETEPPAARQQLGLDLGNWLEEEWDASVTTGLGQGTVWGDETTRIAEEAYGKAYGRGALEHGRRQVGLPYVEADEMQYAKFGLPLEGYLQQYIDAGYIGEDDAENFRAAAEPVAEDLRSESGVSSQTQVAQRRAFNSAASKILRALPDHVRYEFQLQHLGVTMNMVSWKHVPDDVIVPDEWASSVDNGRIVVYDEKRLEAFQAGREGNWLVPRPREDIIEDAGRSVNYAAAGYLKWIWESVTGETWSKPTLVTSGRNKGLPNQFGSMVGEVAAEDVARFAPILEKLGVDIPAEWESNGGWTVSAAELRKVLGDNRSRFINDVSIPFDVSRALSNSPGGGAELLADYEELVRFAEEGGYESPLDLLSMPDEVAASVSFYGMNAEEYLEVIKDGFRAERTANQNFTEAMYNGTFARMLGPLDYEAPILPAEKDLDVSVSGTPDEFRVVDGDTIAYATTDGQETRFRLLGINAPDVHETQDGYTEATDALVKFLNSHDRVTLGAFEQSRYGTTQRFHSFVDGQSVQDSRVYAWLYVDGVPVWNPGEFRADNPRGLPTAVAVPEFETWWRRESGESYEDGV